MSLSSTQLVMLMLQLPQENLITLKPTCWAVPCSSRRDSERLAASTSDRGESRFCRHHCRGVTGSAGASLALDDTYSLETHIEPVQFHFS